MLNCSTRYECHKNKRQNIRFQRTLRQKEKRGKATPSDTLQGKQRTPSIWARGWGWWSPIIGPASFLVRRVQDKDRPKDNGADKTLLSDALRFIKHLPTQSFPCRSFSLALCTSHLSVWNAPFRILSMAAPCSPSTSQFTSTGSSWLPSHKCCS